MCIFTAAHIDRGSPVARTRFKVLIYLKRFGAWASTSKFLAEMNKTRACGRLTPSPRMTCGELLQDGAIDAEWMVLSACNTIAGDKPGVEALSGLARAFFYAGAFRW